MIHYFYGTLQVGIGQTLCSFEHVSCFGKGRPDKKKKKKKKKKKMVMMMMMVMVMIMMMMSSDMRIVLDLKYSIFAFTVYMYSKTVVMFWT